VGNEDIGDLDKEGGIIDVAACDRYSKWNLCEKDDNRNVT
jgi:hypothetical protein